jgi:hypothetical protein
MKLVGFPVQAIKAVSWIDDIGVAHFYTVRETTVDNLYTITEEINGHVKHFFTATREEVNNLDFHGLNLLQMI